MLEDIKKAKKADLEAEIELYREALNEEGKDPVVAAPETLKTNALLVEEIERLKGEHGSPVKVDAEFLEANKSLVAVVTAAGDTLNEGEIVFFGDEELAAAREQDIIAGRIAALTEEILAIKPDFVFGAEGETTVEGLEAVLAKLKEPKAPEQTQQNPTTPAQNPNVAAGTAAAVELVYQGHTVARVQNIVVHGKLYKEVFTNDGQGYRLTPAEFETQVTPRA